MTRSEYDDVIELIEAKITDMIEGAFGRDSLHDRVRFYELETEFIKKHVKND